MILSLNSHSGVINVFNLQSFFLLTYSWRGLKWLKLYFFGQKDYNQHALFNSDVHQMEKELEVERERDKARNIRILEPKFNISEPPPKVAVSFHTLFVCLLLHSVTAAHSA